MAHTCTTCGAVADSPGHLCNPCDTSSGSCNYCGTPEVDTKHVCKDKLAAMQFVCGGCGRVAVEAGNVCKPLHIMK